MEDLPRSFRTVWVESNGRYHDERAQAAEVVWLFFNRREACLMGYFSDKIFGKSYKVRGRWYRIVDYRILDIVPVEPEWRVRNRERRDSGRKKCYDWESEYRSSFDVTYVTREEADYWMRKLSKEWGINRPHLSFTLKSCSGTAHNCGWRIALQKRAGTNKLSTVLHEFAHMLTFVLDDDDPGHGETFRSIVKMLYDKHLPCSRKIAASKD